MMFFIELMIKGRIVIGVEKAAFQLEPLITF
jgi:hypothetical protein